ncbi:hypothetical protein AVEN_234270-1 [Araneus ventricosus]|uniref:Uncharacterized protein n=1 Tax=Araneus ventricosus TaxID=182803 RepID=A0A4Y2A8C6_ARAVE|nr:hypothetical protein AVEN_234270-1 [Araneus ventricosus]
MKVDDAWPWNILCTDEAHFHFQFSVNTQNCRIWDRENPFQIQPLTLHSQNVTEWCGVTAAFIVGPFFSEEIGPSGPVTCEVNRTRYESLLRKPLINLSEMFSPFSHRIEIFWLDGSKPHTGYRGNEEAVTLANTAITEGVVMKALNLDTNSNNIYKNCF